MTHDAFNSARTRLGHEYLVNIAESRQIPLICLAFNYTSRAINDDYVGKTDGSLSVAPQIIVQFASIIIIV
jgi:hypothetical protein